MAVSHAGGPFPTPLRGVRLILSNAFESNADLKIDRAMEILFSVSECSGRAGRVRQTPGWAGFGAGSGLLLLLLFFNDRDARVGACQYPGSLTRAHF